MGGMIAQRVGARPNFGGGEISPKLGERGEPFKALGSTERVGAMLESMHELSAHPPALFLYVGSRGVYSLRVRAVPSGDGAGNRMGSCRARERVTIHGALRKRRAQRYYALDAHTVKAR